MTNVKRNGLKTFFLESDWLDQNLLKLLKRSACKPYVVETFFIETDWIDQLYSKLHIQSAHKKEELASETWVNTKRQPNFYEWGPPTCPVINYTMFSCG